MRMRKRFMTLVAWLMAISLFSTGFATTLTLYKAFAKKANVGKVSVPTIGEYTEKITPSSYFGIDWQKDTDDEEKIVGETFSYDSITSEGATKYSFRNTTLSVRISVNNGIRTTLSPKQYNSDCLVVEATISGEVSSWSGVTNFGVPAAATVGLIDDTVFEKVVVATSGNTVTMRIPIAMIYRLAAAQKGATSTNTSTLKLSLEFEDNGVASADVAKICAQSTDISFRMATDYIS